MSEGSETEEDKTTINDLVAALGGDGDVQLVDSLPIDKEDDLSETEGEASARLVSIVESLLLAASEPLTVRRIRRVLREPTANQIRLALKELVRSTEERGVRVVQVAGGFVLQTHPANAGYVQRFLQARPTRLSRPQLETLAIIAYRQPVTRAEIDHVRGVDSGAVLKLLLEKDLAKIVGKKEEPGRPMLYGTTVNFLEFFNLMSLRELPDLAEFKQLSDETKATLQHKHGMDESETELLGQEMLDFAERERDMPEIVGVDEGESSSEGAPAADAESASAAEDETPAREDAPAQEEAAPAETAEPEPVS